MPDTQVSELRDFAIDRMKKREALQVTLNTERKAISLVSKAKKAYAGLAENSEAASLKLLSTS
jgi:hypothetical protein